MKEIVSFLVSLFDDTLLQVFYILIQIQLLVVFSASLIRERERERERESVSDFTLSYFCALGYEDIDSQKKKCSFYQIVS